MYDCPLVFDGKERHCPQRLQFRHILAICKTYLLMRTVGLNIFTCITMAQRRQTLTIKSNEQIKYTLMHTCRHFSTCLNKTPMFEDA